MAQPRLSRSDLAYEHLLQEILRGRFEPGETLSIYALAEELGISRTPVAEALKRLENQGLVEIIPQVGCRVIRLNAADIAEMFALCGALDGLAAEAAARAGDDRSIKGLRRIADEIRAAVDQDDKADYDERDYALHDGIIQAGQSPRIMRAALAAWVPLRFQLSILPSPADAMQASLTEHEDIIAAIERRAPAAARRAAERHATSCATRATASLP